MNRQGWSAEALGRRWNVPVECSATITVNVSGFTSVDASQSAGEVAAEALAEVEHVAERYGFRLYFDTDRLSVDIPARDYPEE